MLTAAISVDELRSFVGKTGNDLDYWFAKEVDAATAVLASFIGYDVVQTQKQFSFEGCLDVEALLPARQVTQIVSVEYRNALSVDDTAWKTIPSTQYALVVKPRGTALVRYPAGFMPGIEYRVAFVAGFTVVPEDLRTAACYIGAIDYGNSFLAGGGKLALLQTISKNTSQGASASETMKKFEDLEYQWQRLAVRHRIPAV